MKKLYAVLSGMLLFGVLVMGADRYLSVQIADNREIIRNHRSKERFWSSETQKLIMDENTLLIFGSSELKALENYEERVSNFLNSPDMNVVTMGGGYFQSLSHVMELGAVSDEISSKKVALLLSPQWFSPSGIPADAFPTRFGEENLLEFLNNNQISDADKKYVLERSINLLASSPTQLSRVKKYKEAYLNSAGIDGIYTYIMRQYWQLRGKYSVFKQMDEMERELPVADLEHMDFDKMLELAQEQGEASCTNNEFGVNDEYWDSYVKETYEKGEIEEKKEVFTDSVEYEDFKCFLNVAGQLDIEVIVVSIPVNEKWYTFQGMLCNEYYGKINEIVQEYDNVTFVDMTEYADEPYFFMDVMHLGWKGWVRISEALYKEFKK